MNEVQPIRDPEKIERMKNELKKISFRDWFLFVMGINTGLRVSDLLKLQVKDVRNRNYIVLNEKKTGKLKRFRINLDLQSHIENYTTGMKDDDYLFKSKRSIQPIKRVQAYKVLNIAADRAGVQEVGTHTMRKTFGYHYYKKSKDIAMLQEIFNHSAPSVTKRYIGITQDEIDKSLEDFSL